MNEETVPLFLGAHKEKNFFLKHNTESVKFSMILKKKIHLLSSLMVRTQDWYADTLPRCKK